MRQVLIRISFLVVSIVAGCTTGTPPSPACSDTIAVGETCTPAGPNYIVSFPGDVNILGTLAAAGKEVVIICGGNALITGTVNAADFSLFCQGNITIGTNGQNPATAIVDVTGDVNISTLDSDSGLRQERGSGGDLTIFQMVRTTGLDTGGNGRNLRLASDGTLTLGPGAQALAGDGQSQSNFSDSGGTLTRLQVGGNGGDATVIANGGLQLGDNARIAAGNGGAGGNITLTGGNGSTGLAGGGAAGTSQGGDAGNLSLKVSGGATLGADAKLAAGTGGTGGNVTVTGGNGGPGGGGAGGPGGNANGMSLGGSGGDVAVVSFSGASTAGAGAGVMKGNGGTGGNVTANGGDGGVGTPTGLGGTVSAESQGGPGGTRSGPAPGALPELGGAAGSQGIEIENPGLPRL